MPDAVDATIKRLHEDLHKIPHGRLRKRGATSHFELWHAEEGAVEAVGGGDGRGDDLLGVEVGDGGGPGGQVGGMLQEYRKNAEG